MRKITSLFLIAFVAFIIFSCSDESGTNPVDDKINVLYITDSAGHYGQFGEEAKNGMLEALKNYPNINLIVFDAKSDANIAVSEFNKIRAVKKLTAVVTLTSWVSNAIAPLAKQNNISHFAIGSAVFDNKNLQNTIRFTADVEYESNFLQNYLNKIPKVAMMYFVNDYGNGWKLRLEQNLGSKLIKSVSYSDVNDDFRDELNSIKASNPDVLLLISTKEAAIIAKQAKEIGLNVQLVGVRPTFTDFLKNEPAAEGMIFSYPELNLNHKFFNDYFNTYNAKASAFSAEGYDVVSSLGAAINLNITSNENIFIYYKNKELNGSLAIIKFDEFAQATYNFGLMKISNKDYAPIK